MFCWFFCTKGGCPLCQDPIREQMAHSMWAVWGECVKECTDSDMGHVCGNYQGQRRVPPPDPESKGEENLLDRARFCKRTACEEGPRGRAVSSPWGRRVYPHGPAEPCPQCPLIRGVWSERAAEIPVWASEGDVMPPPFCGSHTSSPLICWRTSLAWAAAGSALDPFSLVPPSDSLTLGPGMCCAPGRRAG